jgi:hypothetical protein
MFYDKSGELVPSIFCIVAYHNTKQRIGERYGIINPSVNSRRKKTTLISKLIAGLSRQLISWLFIAGIF